MSLNQFLLDVGSQLQEFIWKDSAQRDRLEEVEHLDDRIRESLAALVRVRAAVGELRTRVAQKEQKESWLASRVEVYLHVGDRDNAWQHALELDRLRIALRQERDRLHRRWRTYRDQEVYVKRLQAKLAGLQQQTYSEQY
jgi:hypothetical protein